MMRTIGSERRFSIVSAEKCDPYQEDTKIRAARTHGLERLDQSRC